VLELVNLGYADYKRAAGEHSQALQQPLSVPRLVHAIARDGIVGAAGATDTINTQTLDPVTRAMSLKPRSTLPAVRPGSPAHSVDGRIG